MDFQSEKSFGKLRLRAFQPYHQILYILKHVKDVKEHTHTFWLITSLIPNGFSIRKKFWKAETESFSTIPSNTVYIKAC